MITKKLATLLAAGALALGALQAQAATISIIGIGADNSFVTVDTTANTITFTDIDADVSNGNSQVTLATGDFLGLQGQDVAYADFSYDPLGVTNPLWTLISGVASFDILAITSVTETSTGVILNGTGQITLNGDMTSGTWSFSADATAPGIFNFSSTNINVPDGGATAMLLGLGVLGMAGLRRKLS